MKTKPRNVWPVTCVSETYPTKDAFQPQPTCDTSRRRFLRQLSNGASIACLLGIPTLAHGQSMPVRFDLLDHHPPTTDDTRVAQIASFEEKRVLWVEPGYLVMVLWTRPAEDPSPVEAFEGATDFVSEYLEESVVSMDQLHNLDQLHELERGLVTQLEPVVAPAEIAVLHIDHDCSAVCDLLEPSDGFEERDELMGIPVF